MRHLISLGFYDGVRRTKGPELNMIMREVREEFHKGFMVGLIHNDKGGTIGYYSIKGKAPANVWKWPADRKKGGK